MAWEGKPEEAKEEEQEGENMKEMSKEAEEEEAKEEVTTSEEATPFDMGSTGTYVAPTTVSIPPELFEMVTNVLYKRMKAALDKLDIREEIKDYVGGEYDPSMQGITYELKYKVHIDVMELNVLAESVLK